MDLSAPDSAKCVHEALRHERKKSTLVGARSCDWLRIEETSDWLSMHRKRFVFVGAAVLNGKQICEDQKYICKTFLCILILFT